MKVNNVKISVIIPVYNVEKYIRKCIESIIEQTYNNLEIILVDDGSLDQSGKICDEYCKLDKRIVVIHKDNGGLSSARNAGLEIVTGDYIGFVDSDDYIEKDMYEILLEMMESSGSKIGVCNKVYSPNELKLGRGKIEIYERNEALREMILGIRYGSHVCDKLFKAELFDDICFPINRIYEDLYTTYKLIWKSSRIAYLPIGKYYYRNNANGISKKRFSSKNLDFIEGLNELESFLKKNEKELVKYQKMSMGKACTALLKKVIDEECEDEVSINILLQHLKKVYPYFLISPYDLGSKLFATMSLVSYKWSKDILKKIEEISSAKK